MQQRLLMVWTKEHWMLQLIHWDPKTSSWYLQRMRIFLRVMFVDGTSMPENHQNDNDKRITNLGAPVEDTDAATKGFIDNQLRKRTFHVTPEGAQGHLKMNNHRISGLANPTQNNDAVHKHYTDSHYEYLQGLITNLTSQVDALQTRVVRLERLSLRKSTEPAEATEAAETVAREWGSFSEL